MENPFKSSADKKMEEQKKEQIMVTKESLQQKYEELQGPYQELVTLLETKGRVRSLLKGGDFEDLTRGIQKITDQFQSLEENPNSETLKKLEEKLKEVKKNLSVCLAVAKTNATSKVI